MIRYLKNRLRAYIDRVIDSKIDDIAEMATSRVDLLSVARSAADEVDLSRIVDYADLAGSIDMSELALQFDTADIAGEVDYAMVAQYVCMSTLAENFDVEEIASHVCLDYKCLAAAILKELRPVEVRPSA